MNNTHCEIMNLGGGVTAIACGVPDKCEHDSDGPFIYEDKFGNVYTQGQVNTMSHDEAYAIVSGYCTCSKCGEPFTPDLNMF